MIGAVVTVSPGDSLTIIALQSWKSAVGAVPVGQASIAERRLAVTWCCLSASGREDFTMATITTPSTDPLHRLAEVAQNRDMRILREATSGEYCATSGSDPASATGSLPTRCSCPGYVRWGRSWTVAEPIR